MSACVDGRPVNSEGQCLLVGDLLLSRCLVTGNCDGSPDVLDPSFQVIQLSGKLLDGVQALIKFWSILNRLKI